MGSISPAETLTLEHRKNYPKPAAPVSPVLSLQSFSGQHSNTIPSILDLPNKRFVTSGRAAIVLALQHAGIKPGDEVLVPAYHCESMVSPVRHLGAKPCFYRIQSNTRVDIASCEALLKPQTRALIATHYFGFAQPLQALRDFCDRHQLILIEDCAHCLFGASGESAIGSVGDYAIASTMKFFPVYDGGILASAKRDLSAIALNNPPLGFELKSAMTILERGISYQRLGLAGKGINLLIRLKDNLWRLLKTLRVNKTNGSGSPASAEGGFGLDPEWIQIRATRASRFVLAKCSKERITAVRRHNYQTYAQALTGVPGCRVLGEPTELTVPLVYAARFDNAEAIFDRLKRHAVPIWRFGEFLDEEVTAQTCPVSFDYSQSILQFPCHQEMRDSEIHWIIDEIKAACSALNSTATTHNR